MSGTHRLRSCAHKDSPNNRAPSSLNLAGAVGTVLAIAIVPAHATALSVFALAAVFVVSRVARLPLSVLLARLAIVQPFVLGVAVLSLFQGKGLAVFAAITLKSTASLAVLQLLAQTTPFHDLLDTLRRLKMPRALVLALALLHRYLFVLLEESQRMRRARGVRTWQRERGGSWRMLSSVIAGSFARSVTRAERISTAMRARGWS